MMWRTLHVPEYTLAVNQGLFEKGELFGFYVNTRQINVSTIYCISAAHTVMPACKAWLSLHHLFSMYSLLGTYLLTTYTYKHMRRLLGEGSQPPNCHSMDTSTCSL